MCDTVSAPWPTPWRIALRPGRPGHLQDTRQVHRASGQRWRVHTNRGVIETAAVVANLLPQALPACVTTRRSSATRAPKPSGRRWRGACMLYRVIRDHDGLSAAPHHKQLIADTDQPFRKATTSFGERARRRPLGPPQTPVLTIYTRPAPDIASSNSQPASLLHNSP